MSKLADLDYPEATGAGSFIALNNGVVFMTTGVVGFPDMGLNLAVVANTGNQHLVAFSVPADLAANGPHTVTHPSGELKWIAMIDADPIVVESGSVDVTFYNERKSVKGTIAWVAKGNRVTGEFDITR
ncbi:hypothetical protein GXB78_21420 [Pseudomonas moraviensis subsp. stanleyae]|uniref:hypothetical protein n=1 Tax=Pseudomonas moraviensis TaxID=321662 RepID=UPI002E2F1D36|nr:hypothetical protein [Pseudomonas moraviensis]MED7669771.1 hypothetical protein [Pseudomonas moraviensis subsp. stanleyae]